jgi:hypothetical protein
VLKQVGSGKGGIDRAEALEGKFAVDSPVERTRFEPPVPPRARTLGPLLEGMISGGG